MIIDMLFLKLPTKFWGEDLFPKLFPVSAKFQDVLSKVKPNENMHALKIPV